jgi:hypothetical protein
MTHLPREVSPYFRNVYFYKGSFLLAGFIESVRSSINLFSYEKEASGYGTAETLRAQR